LTQTSFDPAFSIIDSMLVLVCHFAHATLCRRLRECSDCGHYEVARQTKLGVRAHHLVCRPGALTDFELALANVEELRIAEQLLAASRDLILRDRNYWRPNLTKYLRVHELQLPGPFTSRTSKRTPWPFRLKRKLNGIDTVIGY
jgi:hypothetical protein